MELLILLLLTLFAFIFGAYSHISQSSLSDYIDLIIEKKSYIGFLIIFLAFLGLTIKNMLGWFLSFVPFYSIGISSIVVNYVVDFHSFFDVFTYILFLSLILFSCYLLNTKALTSFFKVNPKKKVLIKVNLLSLIVSSLAVFIVFNS